MSAENSGSKGLKMGKSTPLGQWGRAKGPTSLAPGLEHQHRRPCQAQTETAPLWEAGVGSGVCLDWQGSPPFSWGGQHWASVALLLPWITSPLPWEWSLHPDSAMQPAQSPSPSRVPSVPSSGGVQDPVRTSLGRPDPITA